MPEGDTIFRAARRMNQALAGREVTAFQSVLPQLTRVDDDQSISGRTIESVTAAGKHLLVAFSGDLFLRTHMRMNGSWHLYRPGEKWRRRPSDMRIVVTTAAFLAVGFGIPVAEFLDRKQMERQPDLQKLGPDFLSQEFDLEAAVVRLRSRSNMEIADALLNQRVVGGIGNVYKSEVLFSCGINPFTLVKELSEEALRCLAHEGQRLMRLNVPLDDQQIPGGGLRWTTGRLNPRERLWVYGRSNDPCRKCGTAIKYRKQGLDARGTYWCPSCQGLGTGG